MFLNIIIIVLVTLNITITFLLLQVFKIQTQGGVLGSALREKADVPPKT